MASAPSPNDLTRQQLDELDALLQRMLSLPLGSPEGAAATALNVPREMPLPEMAPSTNVRPTSPPAYAAPSYSPPPVAYQPPNLRDMPAAWREPLAPPVAQLLTMPAASDATPPPVNRRGPSIPRPAEPLGLPTFPIQPPLEFPSTISSETTAPAVETTPAPIRHEPISAAQKPFVLLNKVIYYVLGRMGTPGRFLISDFGQNLIGFAGLALIAYTATKLIQLEGWASLPFDLPWPG